MIQTNQTGKSQSDNIIDELLTFNETSTWTGTGGGSAIVTTANYFNGSGSLYIENSVPGQDATVTNSTQATTIGIDGSYWLSLVFYKNLPDVELQGEVQIFKNGVSYNTQSFIFGSKTTDNDTNAIKYTNPNASFISIYATSSTLFIQVIFSWLRCQHLSSLIFFFSVSPAHTTS